MVPATPQGPGLQRCPLVFESPTVVRAPFLQFRAWFAVKMLISPWMFTWWRMSERPKTRLQQAVAGNHGEMWEGNCPDQGSWAPQKEGQSPPLYSVRCSPGHSQMLLKPATLVGCSSEWPWVVTSVELSDMWSRFLPAPR